MNKIYLGMFLLASFAAGGVAAHVVYQTNVTAQITCVEPSTVLPHPALNLDNPLMKQIFIPLSGYKSY